MSLLQIADSAGKTNYVCSNAAKHELEPVAISAHCVLQQPVTRAQLLDATRIHDDIFDRSIDVQIYRLRRKLEIDPSAPRIIPTERGFGYLFSRPVEPF
jgi:hypothetical protein